MRIILMAAGAGERLWPMSTQDKPKQFLPLFPHPHDTTRTVSMIQRVYALLESLGKKDMISVVTTKDLAHWVSEQLGNVPLHILPHRKDTFGSVSYAALDAAKRFEMNEHDTFLFLPVDHWTNEDFYAKALDLARLLRYDREVIGLMGIAPSFPSQSYGYFEGANVKGRDYLRVWKFNEKPAEAEARKLVNANALWNAGVFCFTRETAAKIIPFFEVMRRVRMDDWGFEKWYESLSDLSFDREVLEKHRTIHAHKFEGVWEDVGTWDRAMKYIPTQIVGEGELVECENVNIVNSLPQPVIVAGLDDVAVVATEQGIIITKKSLAARVKEFRLGRKEVYVL